MNQNDDHAETNTQFSLLQMEYVKEKIAFIFFALMLAVEYNQILLFCRKEKGTIRLIQCFWTGDS